jgi:SulP family sulfate permease
VAKVHYEKANLPGDVFGGLTLWAVFAAQAIAYARLAHATPTAGLTTAIAGAFVFTLASSSLRVSIGPAGGIAAMVGAAVSSVPQQHLAASLTALTLMTAAVLFLAGLLRISFLRRLFPTPVFVGYIAGTGVTILWGQAKDLVLGGPPALIVGGAAIFGVLLLRHLLPRVPGPFVVLLAATVLSAALGLEGRGVKVIGTQLGHFGSFSLATELGWAGWKAMAGPALSLALILYVDALANADMLQQKGDPDIRPRREYFALGAVNALAAMWGGFVAGCSTSRSLVAIRSGAKTRVAGLVAAVLLLLTALSVVKLLTPLPLPALAGVVLVAAVDLIDVRHLRELWRLRRADFVAAMAAGLGVVFLGMIKGVVVGVVFALAEALRRSMQPDRSVFTSRLGNERFYEPFSADAVRASEDVLIYRFGSGLYFGNAEVFLEDMRRIARAAPPTLRTVMINADALGVPDATARDALLKARDVLTARGLRLVFGNTRAHVRDALRASGGLTLVDERQFVEALRRVHGGPIAPQR